MRTFTLNHNNPDIISWSRGGGEVMEVVVVRMRRDGGGCEVVMRWCNRGGGGDVGEGGCSDGGDEDEVADGGGHGGGDGCDDDVGMKVVCRLWWRRKWPESGQKKEAPKNR
ncbi:hypothetical protein Tco_1266113 [Tanacetum coccineum]